MTDDEKIAKDQSTAGEPPQGAASTPETSETVPPTGPKSGAETVPETRPESGPDMGPDIGPDRGSEPAPEKEPETGSDAGPDAGPDTAWNAAPETAAEAVEEPADAVPARDAPIEEASAHGAGAPGQASDDPLGDAPGPDGAEPPTLDDLVPGLDEAIAEEQRQALHAEVEALTAERDALKEKLMRALAEAENVRRRADRDRRDAETYGGTKLARDLLSVHDNMERALAAVDDSLREGHGAFIEGLELTARELVNAFSKHKIELHRPEKGEKFDPNLHQAMFEAPVPGAEPGTVIEVMQPGFTIAGRLLRPALVGVARSA
ncbi:MAG: nucleotide exchange factor GrpE [Pseudomonadota bacterium]